MEEEVDEDPIEAFTEHSTIYKSQSNSCCNVYDFSGHKSVSSKELCTPHLSSRINTPEEKSKGRSSLYSVATWWSLIKDNPLFEHIKDYILSTPFTSLVDINYRKADRGLHRALGERWWPTTHTFHFPCGEIGITPLDFSMITGMSIGKRGNVFIFKQFKPTEQDILGLLPSIRADWKQGHFIKTSCILEYENTMHRYAQNGGPMEGVNCNLAVGSAHSREYALAFLLYLCGIAFFSTQKPQLSSSLVVALRDLETMHQIDWGQAIYASFLHRLDAYSVSEAADVCLTGFYPLLEVWYWDYTRSLYHTVPVPNAYPRISTYLGFHVTRLFRSVTTLAHARYQIESLLDGKVCWRPWIDIHDLARRSLQRMVTLSRSRCLLTGPGLKEDQIVYLGDRHWRQLTGQFGITPSPPYPLKELRSSISTYFMIHNSWQDGSDFIVLVSRDCYLRWWRSVSIGALTSGLVYRDGNQDFITSAAIRDDLDIVDSSQHTTGLHIVGSTSATHDRSLPKLLRPHYTLPMGDTHAHRIIPSSAWDIPASELDPELYQLPMEELQARYLRSLRRSTGMELDLVEYIREIMGQSSGRGQPRDKE